MSRQITDTLKRPDGSAYADVTVRFVADQTSADDGSVVQHSDSTTTTDASGALSVELQNGVYLVYVDGARSLYLGKATITDGDPATLAEVLGASESVTSAVLAAVEAAVAVQPFTIDDDITLDALHNRKTGFVTADAVITLPEWASAADSYVVEILPSAAHTITLATQGGDTIRGGSTVVTGDCAIVRSPTSGVWYAVGEVDIP